MVPDNYCDHSGIGAGCSRSQGFGQSLPVPHPGISGIPVPDGDTRITQNNNTRVTQQTGEPPGGRNQRPGTDPNAPGDNDPGLPYDNTEVPKTGPLS